MARGDKVFYGIPNDSFSTLRQMQADERLGFR